MIHQSRIQEVLRKTKDKLVSVDLVMEILKITETGALEMLVYLEDVGYLNKVFDEVWQHSISGKILANEKLKKSFRVETLKNQLNGMIKRVHVVNSSPDYPFYVDYVVVTSEYPITQKSSGIHIAFSMSSKNFTEQERERAEDLLRERHKGNFGNRLEYFSYPRIAVGLFLKSRSPVLKLKQYGADDIRVLDGYKLFELPLNKD